MSGLGCWLLDAAFVTSMGQAIPKTQCVQAAGKGSRGPNVRNRKTRRRVSSHTARHSNKATSTAEPWLVGRGLQADVLVLVPNCPRSGQLQVMGRQLSPQAWGSWHLSVFLSDGLTDCPGTRQVQCHSMCISALVMAGKL